MNEERIIDLADLVLEKACNFAVRVNNRTKPYPWINWGFKCTAFVGAGVPICALGIFSAVVDSMPRGRGN